MGMFDMTATAGLVESGKFLSPGIHNAKFNGLSLGEIVSQKDGRKYSTMTLSLNVDGYGEFTHNFFEPTSAERSQSQFGENPSQVEHFMVALRQIFDALDPEIGNKFDANDVVIGDKKVDVKSLNFMQLVKLAKVMTDPYAGTEVEVKLIPQNNGFNAIPGFPAKINRQGKLGIATRFIGHDLVLSQSEQKKIDAAANAKPTNMQSNSDTSLDGLGAALGIDKDEDLPF